MGLEPTVLYVTLAMSAMLAATSKSLLTSIALVAETVGPSFIILTVVSASISYFFTGSKSFYKSQLTRKSDSNASLGFISEYSSINSKRLVQATKPTMPP